VTDALAQLVAWLNAGANAVARPLLAPLGTLPGWLSATLVSAASGLGLLAIFKYTSNQRAIRRASDDIQAHLLALRLFTDSPWVAFRAQGRILWGAVRQSALAVVPTLVMIVPVSLLLGQLGAWYQSRPLRVGEEAALTVRLGGSDGSAWPQLRLDPSAAVEVAAGPVRVLSRREMCWNVRVREDGYHRLVFHVDGQAVTKELAVGEGLMRTSSRRPGWYWPDMLRHPCERPFGPNAPVRSIEIEYPDRLSWSSGTNSWLIYWFAVSMATAFCLRRPLKVNI
jgi:hypothetical protein